MGRLFDRHYRWFEISILAAIAVVALLAVVAAFVSWPGRGLVSALDRNLVTPLALAAIAYFFFYVLTVRRATRGLLRVAQQTPEKMFPHAPEAGSAKHIFGRDRLIEEIVNGVRSSNPGPQIIVGGTGSGKTTLLLALASQLADEHAIVPIVLNLQDQSSDLEKKTFTELAIDRFEELVDPHVKTREEADKLWRLMRKRGRIAILADDLDRSLQVNESDPDRSRIRLALDEARRRCLPLVVTTRPSGLPSGLSEPPIDLSDTRLTGKRLERKDLKGQRGKGEHRKGHYLGVEDRAAEYVLARAGVKKHDKAAYALAKGLVAQRIDDGDLLENAFYLRLLADLLRAGALEGAAPGAKYAVRLALLETDRNRICGSRTLNEDEWRRREEALGGIERLAATWLAPTDGQALEALGELAAVRDGERFGLLSLDDRGHPQFKHEVLHAYYASRAIVAEEWKPWLERRPTGARVRLALVLRAARGDDEDFCREACDLLLGGEDRLTPDQRLLRAAGAAELALAGSFSGRDREIANGCLQAKVGAGPVSKRAVLKQLEILGGRGAVDALWEYAQDDDYGARWAAVDCLIRRCTQTTSEHGEAIRHPSSDAACTIVEKKIEQALADGRELLAQEGGGADDWDRRIILLKQAAWMLPALRTNTKDRELRGRVDGHLRELLRLESKGVTSQRGLEASIAQGFKTDARLDEERRPDPDAERMLRERAVFWYSQLNLVHALALRMADDPAYEASTLDSIMAAVEKRELEREATGRESAAAVGDLHPMLCEATKLCRKALRGKDREKRLKRMKQVVWRDEGVVVSRRPRKLDPKAAQLVGEIAVLLNLHETGDAVQRGEFGEKVTMPHCMKSKRDRHGFREACHDGCGFGLCPFQPARDEPSAHRELSRAFCRDQRQRASFWRMWPRPHRVVSRVRPELWEWLEDRAGI